MITNPQIKNKPSLFLSFIVFFLIGNFYLFYKQYKTYNYWLKETQKTILSSAEKKKRKYQRVIMKYDNPLEIGEYLKELSTPEDPNAAQYPIGYLEEERKKLNKKSERARATPLEFIERGPANSPGRTRIILDLPNSSATNRRWLAASVTGGIWESKDEGESWIHKTEGFGFLSVSTMCATQDGNTIYAGTGEVYLNITNGSGVLKSTDGGNTWVILETTKNDAERFGNVNRIICHPTNSKIVIAVTSGRKEVDTSKGYIMKSVDGGQTWTQIKESEYAFYQIISTKNFRTMFAVDEYGYFYKSTDEGATWNKGTQFFIGSNRVELAISSNNENIIYAQSNVSKTESELWVSKDAGVSFRLGVQKNNGDKINYLDGQGWYDNTVLIHPFNDNVLYHGGVSLFATTFEESTDTNLLFSGFSQKPINLIHFIQYDNSNKGLEKGRNYKISELKKVEIRFGNKSQKAHRFTVGNWGAGASPSDYIYKNYVDVPFEVWDVENNKQMAVSFRDQNKNGQYDLIHHNIENNPITHSREYIFIHDELYTPNSAIADIAENAGYYSYMYATWPTLNEHIPQFETNIETVVTIEYKNVNAVYITSKDLADVYSERSGINSYIASAANDVGVHPDQHHLSALITSQTDKTWKLLNGNDGGIYVTLPHQYPGIQQGDFVYRGEYYNTTQFYGTDKHPWEDRYVGGTQDNGSWMTPKNVKADKSTKYVIAGGGDGFEAVWHATNPDKIITTLYYNILKKSVNGGESFNSITAGISGGGTRANNPFVTQIAYSKSSPNQIAVINDKGAHISKNFGDSWKLAILSDYQFNKTAKIAISDADPNYIWAGAAMGSLDTVSLSTDGGENFNPVGKYTNKTLGKISAIVLDPTDKNTAYLLFSFYSLPKVLKTTNKGQNWTDISGFDNELGVSSKGFPNVKLYSMVVHPNDGKIWISTELGIVESSDQGNTWHKLEGNIPNIPIMQMKLSGDQIILSTFGRGIWTYTLDDNFNFNQPPIVKNVGIAPNGKYAMLLDVRADYDKLSFYINGVINFSTNDVKRNKAFVIEFPNRKAESEMVSMTVVAERMGITMNSNTFVYTAKPLQTNTVENISISFNKQLVISNSEWLLNNTSFIKNIFSDRITLESPHPLPFGYEGTALLLQPLIISKAYPNVVFQSIAYLKKLGSTVSPSPNSNIFAQLEYSYDGVTWDAVDSNYNASNFANFSPHIASNSNPSITNFPTTTLSLEKITKNTPFILRFRIRNFDEKRLVPWGFALENLYIQKVITSLTESNAENISIYPNPLQNEMNVRGLQKFEDHKTAVFYGVNGDIAQKIEIEEKNWKNDNTITINVSELKNGIYLFHLIQDAKIEVKRKVIVKR